MKALKYILASALCLLASTACSGNKNSKASLGEKTPDMAATQTEKTGTGRALVVFFSHPGDNYAVGNIEVGNTKIVADYISELTGADQFEIVCVKDYNMAYKPLCDLAKQEQQNGELPDFKGAPEHLNDYDTIFVGGPVWWGTYPQVMFTFFSRHDLNGKTLIPFTTHEGSGLGRCIDDLSKAYPKATITGEFSIYGHDVREGKPRVEKWIKKLGYVK